MLGLDPTYFLDEMSLTALGLAWDGYQKSRREAWEQTRIIAYNVAAPYLKGKPSKKEFMPFKWDNESKKTDSESSSKERFDELTTLLNLN